MVYSNAVYFGSHFDSLTDEILTIFEVKQKSQKNNGNLNKIKDYKKCVMDSKLFSYLNP